jgi:hypothetical protein
MPFFKFAGPMVAGLALTGCATLSGYPERPAATSTDTAAMQRYFTSDVLANYHGSDASKRDGQDRQAYRDAVTNGRIAAFDIGYIDLVRALQGTDTGTAIGADLAVITLNAIGATTGGTATKEALAVASAGIVGAKASIDKNIFYQRTLPALVAQMNASRQQILVDIRTGLARPDGEYPLEQAITDTNRYYWAGTVMGAVTGVSRDAGVTEAKATAELKTIQRDAGFIASRQSRTDILGRIKALDDNRIIRLALLMQGPLASRDDNIQQIVRKADAATGRFSDPKLARQAMMQWIVNESGGADAFRQWADNLSIAEK